MRLINKTQLFIGLFLLVAAGIPATIFLSQQTQDTRSKASASTTLALTPTTTEESPAEKNVGDDVSFDVIVDPGNNLPSLVRLELEYDPTKFTASQPSFVPNTDAFPVTVDGPILQTGKVLVSVSIGSDPTKAIQQPTKVGTLTLKAVGPTVGELPSKISFGPRSQVLSLSSNDQATENVLASTTPAYVIMGVLPTPTPMDAALSFNVFMHGIGNSGDNANPNDFDLSTKNPLHPSRDVTVQIYNDQNQLVATKAGTVTFASSSGTFKGIVNVGNEFTLGEYTVRIKEQTHLRRLVPGIQQIKPQTENKMPDITFVAGDINNDNTLNILDYNILLGCYSDLLPATNCDDTRKVVSDLNDNGQVNQTDYNLFLREITVQAGN